MKAEWEVLKHERGKYIFIRDIGHNSGRRSVTNDAEYVVSQLFITEDITENTRIFYEDSDGRIDELIHVGKVFKAFKPGHEGIEVENG